MNDGHNHDVNQATFGLHPTQRQLPDEEKQQVLEMVQVCANKKFLREVMATIMGKMVTLKDIHNICTQNKKKSSDVPDMQLISDTISSYPGLTVEYVVDENNTLNGLFIQDNQMHKYLITFQKSFL